MNKKSFVYLVALAIFSAFVSCSSDNDTIGGAGCGPAFACLFAEALADGGVACGLPRKKAIEYAAQMLMGSAQLLLESGQHPGTLKDAVCSPGGSTIAGVRALEQGGFRASVINAVESAYKRTKELGK